MRVIFLDEGWDDYSFWIDGDRATLRRLNKLIEECSRTPYFGTGKPEALLGNWSGWWSRRITDEHRLVYRVDGDDLVIAQCRWHYSK